MTDENPAAERVVTEPAISGEAEIPTPRRRRRRAPASSRTSRPSLITGPLPAESEAGAGPAYLSVPGWQGFLHYTDRRNAWVKLHTAWLADYRFQRLEDHQKLALMLIWMLAADANRIPADPEWIGWKVGMAAPVDVRGLVEAGFLELHGMRAERLPGVKMKAGRPDPPTYLARAYGLKQPPLPPEERPITWPGPEGEEPSTSGLLDSWEKRQPI